MFYRITRALLVISLLFITSGNAMAIVSMEALHTSKPKAGFSGNVELSISNSSGNTDKEEYNLGSRLQWHQGEMTDFLLLRADYAKSAGIKSSDNAFAHLRHIQQFQPRIAWEAFLQVEKDQFARLEYRGLAGGGLRFNLFEKENRGAIFFGLGAYHSEERIDKSYADAGTETLWRGNSYLLLQYQISPDAALQGTTYYQPASGNPDDYRLLQQAALKVKLTDLLSLVVSYDLRFDNAPPLGVEKRDSTFKTSFSVDF
jgi:putative salt-induced outer membrane protein YdiY